MTGSGCKRAPISWMFLSTPYSATVCRGDHRERCSVWPPILHQCEQTFNKCRLLGAANVPLLFWSLIVAPCEPKGGRCKSTKAGTHCIQLLLSIGFALKPFIFCVAILETCVRITFVLERDVCTYNCKHQIQGTQNGFPLQISTCLYWTKQIPEMMLWKLNNNNSNEKSGLFVKEWPSHISPQYVCLCAICTLFK